MSLPNRLNDHVCIQVYNLSICVLSFFSLCFCLSILGHFSLYYDRRTIEGRQISCDRVQGEETQPCAIDLCHIEPVEL